MQAPSASFRVLLVDPAPRSSEKFAAAICGSAFIACDAFDPETETEQAETSDRYPRRITFVHAGSHAEVITPLKRSIEQNCPFHVCVFVTPGLGGLREIRAIDPGLEILAITRGTPGDAKAVLRELGTTNQLLVLHEPLDSTELAQAILALARRRTLSLRLEARSHELTETLAAIELEVTHREEAEFRLRHNALHDTLTRLPNRSLMLDRLQQCILRTRRNPEARFAVAILDIDGFHAINDVHGHATGDMLLRTLAGRLRDALRDMDSVSRFNGELQGMTARFGGDEFVVLLDSLAPDTDVQMVLRQLIEDVCAPIEIGNDTLTPSLSAGVVIASHRQLESGSLLRDADTALQEAKRQSKRGLCIFEEGMHHAALDRLQIRTDLQQALHSNGLSLHYQPLADLRTGRMVAVEALARWNHTTEGPIPPSRFIPVAIESGLISQISQWALGQALMDLSHWRQQVPWAETMRVSVNISPNEFASSTMTTDLAEQLDAAGVPARQLAIEITESCVIHARDKALKQMTALRELGCPLLLDDFGTGYTSIRQLQDIPVSGIKIDRSFIQALSMSVAHRGAVSAIRTLADSQNLELIAEGIETSEQLDQARQYACHLGQGYLLSRPKPAAAILRLLQANAPLASVGELRN